jgi:hypothetical protein
MRDIRLDNELTRPMVGSRITWRLRCIANLKPSQLFRQAHKACEYSNTLISAGPGVGQAGDLLSGGMAGTCPLTCPMTWIIGLARLTDKINAISDPAAIILSFNVSRAL